MADLKFICCSVLAGEIKKVLNDLHLKADLSCLTPGLHVDNRKLEQKLVPALEDCCSKNPVLIYGSQCHPEMKTWQRKYNFRQPEEPDCIGILLGQERREQFSREARTFYLTPGWLQHWKEIFEENLGWDKTEAHLNFGRYERILFLDSGISTVDEEKLLEFFDYTGVPIEIRPVGLNHITNLIQKLIQYK
ncbi:hypothetical protein MOTE_18980 [Moorella thermoacetica]|uniref:DUF1638 domain-containing protein n=1 Tax=Neomoorella thermoacetica TaxID=1525 RepID=A0A1J5NJL4_NEOTH|nr:hypothetical protein MOTE_18980 [Moorella thermoacetica]